MDKQLKKAIIITGIAALVIRIIYGLSFLISELAVFNDLEGLDMATLLEFSQWDRNTDRSAPMFVLHRFLLFFCYLAAGKSHNVLLIYIVQSLFGAAASMFAVIGVWNFSKSFRASLLAGLMYALYGPFLLYESVALQEAVLTHTLTIGFVIYLVFLKKNSALYGILSGIILGLNSAGRPASAFLAVAMAFYGLWIKRKEKISAADTSFSVSLGAVWLAAALFNGYFRNSFNPFFNVMPHLADVHNAAPAAAGTLQQPSAFSAYFNVLLGAVKNVPALFGMREIPENLDYDTLRQILSLLSFGPLIVIPFASSGIISQALLKRKELIVCYMALFFLAFPLAARIPIGRYRLLLMPFFIFFAALFIEEIIKNKPKRLALAAIFIGVVGTNLCFASPLVRPNPAAHHTLGLAAMKTRANFLPHLHRAWELSQYTYKPSGLMLIVHHIQKYEFSRAEKIIMQNKTDAPEFIYYHALVKTAQNQPKEAEKLLQSIPDPQRLGTLYPKFQKLNSFLQSKR